MTAIVAINHMIVWLIACWHCFIIRGMCRNQSGGCDKYFEWQQSFCYGQPHQHVHPTLDGIPSVFFESADKGMENENIKVLLKKMIKHIAKQQIIAKRSSTENCTLWSTHYKTVAILVTVIGMRMFCIWVDYHYWFLLTDIYSGTADNILFSFELWLFLVHE